MLSYSKLLAPLLASKESRPPAARTYRKSRENQERLDDPTDDMIVYTTRQPDAIARTLLLLVVGLQDSGTS